MIHDCLSPKFIKNFQVEYRFEERQRFKFQVYGVDDFDQAGPVEGHNFIGELEFMLHEAVTSKNQTFRRGLVNKEKPAGTIVIMADETKSS